MKILYYSPHPTHDIVSEVGYATHQRETIIALEQLGHEVLPVIMGGATREDLLYEGGKASDPSGFRGFLKRLLPSFIWVSIRDLLVMRHDTHAGERLEKAIQEFQPDLIYERSEYLQDSGIKPAQKHRIKYYLEVNAPFVEEMKAMQGYSIWLWLGHRKERKKYKAADKIFVVSTVLKDFLIRRYKVDSHKIVVSPNRINKEKFLERAALPLSFEVNFRNEAPIIGFVGSILPHHHLDLLIEGFAEIIHKGLEANLLIVGEGTHRDVLQELVKQRKVEDRVIFTGKVPFEQVPAIINCMDICVMSGSNWYGSPIKIFEYGILGKSVIAPRTEPVSEVMTDGVDGILVEQNKKDIAQALEKLIIDKDYRERLGQSFKEKIIREYQWKHAAEMIVG